MISDFSGLNFLFLGRGGVTTAVNGGANKHFVQKQMRVALGATVRRPLWTSLTFAPYPRLCYRRSIFLDYILDVLYFFSF